MDCFSCVVAILAFSMDFQSMSFIYPAPIAWEILYIARLASVELAPARAAAFAMPIMAFTEVSKSIFWDVNLPTLEVISVKL